MKTENSLTVGQLKKWLNDNNISDDTPIGIYLGDSERGSIAYGVIGETENEYDDDDEITNISETTGEHCYCKNMNCFTDETESKQVVVITDGCHYYEED